MSADKDDYIAELELKLVKQDAIIHKYYYDLPSSLIFDWQNLDGEELNNLLAKAKEEGRKEFRKDAMRYQWLRSQVNGEQLPMAQVVWKSRFIRDSGEWTNLIDGNNLDEHIDLMLAKFPKDPTYSDLIDAAPKPQGETK